MNKTKISKLVVLCLVSSILLWNQRVGAQFGLDVTGVGLDFIINQASSVPAPDSTVRMSIESYSTDLNRADITWEVNGVVKDRGVGKLNFDLAIGPVGSATNLKVTAQTREGYTITHSKIFRPGLVDLIWQADSWTAPFYKGKGLVTAKSKVVVQAVPYILDGNTRIPARSLYYTWTYDFDPLVDASGVGKDTIMVNAPDLFDKMNLRVQVATLDNRVFADAQVTIAPSNPEVIIWKSDPLSGIDYDRPIASDISFDLDEIGLVAGGLYFPKTHTTNPGLSYSWSLNSKPAIVDEEKPHTLTIRRTEGGGEGQVSLDIIDPFDRIIAASKSFTVRAMSKGLE